MASKRKIRWDRVSVAAVVLLVLIFLLGSCMQRCSDNKAKNTADNSQQDSAATEEQTAPPAATTTQPVTTKDPAAQTMANVPVMITDAEPGSGKTTTTVAGDESSDEPAYVLPAGYQERSSN